MPHLFALQGAARRGKSSSLISLFHSLQTKYPSATIQSLYNGGTRAKDIAVIMSGVNGFVVGIESQGDPNSRLQQSLTTFATAKCDIIFCACRTTGMTVGWVNALSATYSVQFVPQTFALANNQSATNTATALSLMQLAGI